MKIKNRIRTLLIMMVCQFFITSAYSQIPEKMSYQAVIRNGVGELVKDQPIGIRIQIKEGSEFGASVFVETHQAVTNENGLVSLEIGAGTAIIGSLADIDWSLGPYYLQTEVDPAGGVNYGITGGSQLLSVPYALYAKSSGNSFSGNYNDLLNRPEIPVIHDSLISGSSLWSSVKINNELAKKVNAEEVYTKSALRTSGKANVHFGNISDKPVNLDEDSSDDVTLSGDQTLAGNKAFTGTVSVNDPQKNTDAANKAYVDFLKTQLQELQAAIGVSDADNNHYRTVKIGDQLWMAENLKTTLFNDGNPIPHLADSILWNKAATPAYCWYLNDESKYRDQYGALYNTFVINTGKLCPTGWHVPTTYDWHALSTFLGGYRVAGGKMKEAGTNHWMSPNAGADNSSGFTAMPGVYRSSRFSSANGYSAKWWSNEENYSGSSLLSKEVISSNTELSSSSGYDKTDGLNVRCIKDVVNLSGIAPVLTTENPGQNVRDSAITGGNIYSEGGSAVTIRGVCWDSIPNPTVACNKTTEGSGMGRFASKITGLKANTTYYIKAYATNLHGTGYGNEQQFTTLPLIHYDSIKDVEGKAYKTVKIGKQTWMAENLKTTHFNDFTSIPTGYSATEPAVHVLQNDSIYGSLYNWYAVETDKLCPAGWHVPSNEDWFYIESLLGGENVAGGKLKEAGTAHWPGSNAGSENRTGFTALPGGSYLNGGLTDRNSNGFWWSNTEYDDDRAKVYFISNCCTFINTINSSKSFGFSVRCLKDFADSTPQVPVVTTEKVSGISQIKAASGGTVHLANDSPVSERGVCWSTNPGPGITNFKVNNGNGTGSYTCEITGLYPNETYYTRAYAINSAGVGYGEEYSFTTMAESSLPMKDIDDNEYETVIIGNQRWMAQNLRAKHLTNGTPITQVQDTKAWSSIKIPAYCWYNGKENLSYGLLYNWYTVAGDKICPAGWHVPTGYDWLQLTSYLGGNEIAGSKLKESGTLHWNDPNKGADNISNFAALPGGYRSAQEPRDYYQGIYGYWWTSDELPGSVVLNYYDSKVNFNLDPLKNSGYSIRCIADEGYKTSAQVPQLITAVVSDIAGDKAVSGGTIISEGGAAVIERGLCWGLLHNPEITANKTLDGEGPGSFTSAITGLDCRVYYVRAYATNAAGTGYGNEVAFQAKGTCPLDIWIGY